MRRFLPAITLLLIFALSGQVKAQLAQDSWAFGFGFSYPRFFNVNTSILNTNYGGFLSLNRNFTEHLGLRLRAGYSHMESEWGTPASVTTTNLISGDLGLILYFQPCESVSPYLVGGGGINYRMLDNKATATLDDNKIGAQLNTGLGLEWRLDTDLKLTTEFNYNLNFDSELDGALGIGEINGRDSYITANIGILYYFDQGEPSKYCQLYTGISAEKPEPVDYNKIEDIVKRNLPKEVTKEVVVEKPSVSAAPEKWVLIGVNFDFNSAKLRPESYPILIHAIEVLLTHTDLKVEVQGYTDNVGSESYNQKLSEKRATEVMNYLVSHGVSTDRLTAVGYGEANPVGDNKTAEGRAMNRRIEFKASN